MTNAIKFLSDDALIKVAAYFASLDPAPVPSGPAGPAKPDPVEAGKGVAAACAGCHGNAGVSQIPGIPSLVGLDPKYLVEAMKAYKDGQRKNDTMKAMLALGERCGHEQRRACSMRCKSRRAPRRRPPATRPPARPPRRVASDAMARAA